MTAGLSYSHPLRRRARRAAQLLRVAASPANYPRTSIVPTYWWDDVQNFGDQLTRTLLRDEGIITVPVRPRFAALVGVGSVIEHLPPDYSGTVWGSGLMFDRELRLPLTTFLAVRGALTRERLGLDPSMPLGDPGLLVRSPNRGSRRRYELGVVPHFTHIEDPTVRRFSSWGPSVLVVDVAAEPAAVVRAIASCDVVVTSSLHGLIMADALRIPAVWVQLGTPLAGGTFKFHDHESVVAPSSTRQVNPDDLISIDRVVQLARTADPVILDRTIAGLRGTLAHVRAIAQSSMTSPILAWRSFGKQARYGSIGNQLVE